jgi:hypothetical protein
VESPTSTISGILPLPDYVLETFNPVAADGLNPSLPAAAIREILRAAMAAWGGAVRM